jgi:monomeric sarcosine oxidase
MTSAEGVDRFDMGYNRVEEATTNPQDVIVLGAGGVGSAAAFHLARRGVRVLALDRYGAAHERGSSHGRTRIIRQAYFEHSDYVPLLRRAYDLWRELEAIREETLFRRVGLLEVGPPDGALVPGVLEAARRHGLDILTLSRSEAADRFPMFRIPDGFEVVLERNAGYLRVEACVLAHLEEARRAGAVLRFDEPAIGWQATKGVVVVRTGSGTYAAANLVICGGAWAGSLLQGLGVRLEVVRKHLHWVAARDPRYDEAAGCPTFLFELPEGRFYGFPDAGGAGVKVAEHTGGEPVADPSAVDRTVDPADRARVVAFLRAHLPGVSDRSLAHAVCMYTMSPDGHFLVDLHPEHANVAFVAGLSGHGFKFASVLGEILADLALDGRTAHPVGFLRLRRFDAAGDGRAGS